ncbi:MAG: hypothetical protein LBT40_04700 [Deltaproteobacteria bacterium]|nr:hypothetical protein [Deltaproteobacteria bacterium]
MANVINTADFDNGTVILDCDIDCFAKASQNASTPPEPVRAATLYAACTEFLIRDDEDYPLRRDVTFILDVGSSLVPSSPLFRSVKARLKALSEGHAASAAFLSNASGLVAGDGITQAISAASDAGPSFFTFISYDKSRYCTGLSSDVKGLSLLFGASCGADVSAGRLTVAAFFESGDVDHDPFNDFAGPGSVRGTCNAEHVGGLLLVRLDLAKSDAGFTCADASFRAGRASVAFRNVEFGSEYSYDLKSNYSGFHVGVGHVFNVTDSTSIDFCGNWLFTRQGGNEHVACGERIRFDDVSSRRLRAGIRLTAAIPGTVKPFFGVGCEHELDGRARARIRDLPADVPELKGGSGIGEIGLSVAATDSLTLDIGVLGSAGTRPASAGQ